jgi:hypothetical protein
MDKKDFSIYFEPAATSTNKVDIGIVTGTNLLSNKYNT